MLQLPKANDVTIRELSIYDIAYIREVYEPAKGDKDRELFVFLNTIGAHIGAFKDGKCIFLFLSMYGSKPKRAYIAYMYMDSSYKNTCGKIYKALDTYFKYWRLIFKTSNIFWFKNHLVRDKNLYVYKSKKWAILQKK
jgi:hypothetical protein